MSKVAVQIFKRHFSAKTYKGLIKKGILPMGIQGNGFDLPSYIVNDKGTCRVLSFSQMISASK